MPASSAANTAEPDQLIAVLAGIAAVSERQTEAISSLGRLVMGGQRLATKAALAAEAAVAAADKAARVAEAAVRAFADEQGTRQAEYLRIERSLDLLRGEIRRALERLTPLERDMTLMAYAKLDDDPESGNGNGNGDGG